MKKVLLYSGGMDSWLISKIWKPDVLLYIDIHGRYSKEERKRLPSNAVIVDMPFLGEQEQDDSFIPMRNLYFLMIASHYGDTLCLGATLGDGSKDKSTKFLEETEATLKDLWDDKKCHKNISVETRFSKMSKGQIIDEYLQLAGTLEEIKEQTFSCYTPVNGHECMNCYPCFRKFAMLYSRGCEYTKEERRKIYEYVKREVIPTKEQGGYSGTYYTERKGESEDLIKAVNMLIKEFEND